MNQPMPEELIEKAVADQMGELLKAQKIYDFKLMCRFADDGTDLQSTEGKNEILMTVVASPRQYETPTIADARIDFSLNLIVRADVDFNGKNWRNVTRIVQEKLQEWQDEFAAAAASFTFDNFDFTGFQLTGGDSSLDKENQIWVFTQTASVYGIILKKKFNG